MSSIFLSHNHSDKPFARRLAKDLEKLNVKVWLDEAEIKIGDSLVEKIREGIDKMEYVGVILTNNSVNSEWVKKEVDIAMNQEIGGKKVKVLPLLLDNCELPGFLLGKLYADFRIQDNYQKELRKVADVLGVKYKSFASIDKDSPIDIVEAPNGKLIVDGMNLKDLKGDSKYDSKYDSWEILSSLERYLLGYSSNPNGITMSKISKLFAVSAEKMEAAFKKLEVNDLVEIIENNPERIWRTTEAGKKFREQNYWSTMV